MISSELKVYLVGNFGDKVGNLVQHLGMGLKSTDVTRTEYPSDVKMCRYLLVVGNSAYEYITI